MRWSFAAYILLVLFDGALRKWFLPFLSSPLLLVRDGLAIATCFYALWQSKFATNGYVIAVVLTTLVASVATMTMGHQNALVMIYGARIYLFHFPLIFIYANALTSKDLELTQKLLLYTSVVSTVVLVMQFYSPQSAWINRGIGGDESGSGFQGGALGFARPAGLFSFTSGNVQFYSLAFAVVIAGWLSKNNISKILLTAATVACVIAIPISISRGYMVQAVLTILFAILAAVGQPKYIKAFGLAAVASVMMFSVLNLFPFFQEATKVLTVRFDLASSTEGGIENTLLTRVFGEKYFAFTDYWDLGFWGAGLGYSTNVGSLVLSGEIQFLSAEDEWGRTTSEFGTVLGGIIIMTRTLLGLALTWGAWKLMRRGQPLAWILASVVLLTVFSGQFGNPTGLGIAIAMTVMMVAALQIGTQTSTKLTP